MLSALTHGEASVTTLSEPFVVSAPAISKHLRVLERSGLIIRRRQGRVHYCRLRAEPLREAGDWIEEQRAFWEKQFDALAKYLEKETDACSNPHSSERESPSGSKGGSSGRGKASSGRGPTRKH
jgi:hypothetical protein